MKKVVLTLASTVLALGAFAVPTFAAEPVTKTIEIGYNGGDLPDPENPDNPTWSVTIPRGVMFTKESTTANFDVKLNTIKDGGLAADKKVEIKVKSALAYELKGGSGINLKYTLSYGEVGAAKTEVTKDRNDNSIGFLLNDPTDPTRKKATLEGIAEMSSTDAEMNASDGTYVDQLTYSIHPSVPK